MLIKNNEDLINLCKLFKNKKVLFIDTEFDRKNTYFSKLSYITIYDGTRFWIIDALSNLNLNILKKIISNNEIIKVFHGSQQDLEIFNNLKIKIKSIFDTQVAAQFCGYEQPISYSTAVLNICKVKINKDLQNSDWLKRPINQKIKEYLKNDVKFLKKIFNYFYKILKKNKNLEYFREEMQQINNKNEVISSSILRKKINNETIAKKNFQKLMQLREKIACSKNLPKNWIFQDDQILNIIKNHDFEKIVKNKNLTKNEKKMIVKIFKTIKIIKKKSYNINILNILSLYRSEVSKKYKIAEQLIASKNDLNNFISNGFEKKSKWRKKLFFKTAKKILKKQVTIKIKKDQIYFN